MEQRGRESDDGEMMIEKAVEAEAKGDAARHKAARLFLVLAQR